MEIFTLWIQAEKKQNVMINIIASDHNLKIRHHQEPICCTDYLITKLRSQYISLINHNKIVTGLPILVNFFYNGLCQTMQYACKSLKRLGQKYMHIESHAVICPILLYSLSFKPINIKYTLNKRISRFFQYFVNASHILFIAN